MITRIAASVGARNARTQPVMRPWALTRPHLPLHLEPFSNERRKVVEHFREVSSRFALGQHRGDEKPRVEQGDTLAEVAQCLCERHAVILPVVNQPEIRLPTGSGISSATIPSPS